MFPNGRIIIGYLEKSVLSVLNGMSPSKPRLQSWGEPHRKGGEKSVSVRGDWGCQENKAL